MLLSPFFLLLGCLASSFSGANPPDPQLATQRQLYSDATRALAAGNRHRFRTLQSQLGDYPLAPYLEYSDLTSRIEQVDAAEFSDFIARHGHTPLGPWLRQGWLNQRARQRDWGAFVAHYDSALRATELACHHAHAQYAVGDRQLGIQLARELWQVGTSQPRACDPVFAHLIEGEHIDDDLAWRRFVAALMNHEFTLARYVTGFFNTEKARQRALWYLEVDRNPRRLAERHLFEEGGEDETLLIFHGLTHLAPANAPLARDLWDGYRRSHPFTASQAATVEGALIQALYNQGHRNEADDRLVREQQHLAGDILDWRLRELLKAADWPAIVDLGEQLIEHPGDLARWHYWRARALQLSGQGSSPQVARLLEEIRHERSFHGFLAAEWLGQPHSMNHRPVAVSDEALDALARTPVFQRIRELLHHNELVWARREWQNSLPDHQAQPWLAAARLVSNWGWHHQAIVAMAHVQYWDDIDIRFPVPYQSLFEDQARASGVPVQLLLAIARQESALNPTAVSPAGARGLMQLMPATARETARGHGIPYTHTRQLADPDINIRLGTRYYQQMLRRFANNRILATAAYNAGPHRVDTWRRRTGGTLPFDAWIETIPFRETRNYVQNVLTYSAIYAHHLGVEFRMLGDAERDNPL